MTTVGNCRSGRGNVIAVVVAHRRLVVVVVVVATGGGVESVLAHLGVGLLLVTSVATTGVAAVEGGGARSRGGIAIMVPVVMVVRG